jgi:hypothetical protein
MIALAQGMAGVALVMGFALLCIRQIGAASVLLAVQCVAVAVSAVTLQQPLMAIPPVLLAVGAWFAPDYLATLGSPTSPIGGSKLGVSAAAVLAVLCQSQGNAGLPLAIVLLSVLLAATRRHALMHVMALVGLQNGVVLAGCLLGPASIGSAVPLLIAGLVLPLPLAACLVLPALTWRWARAARWVGWLDPALALLVFAATLLVPLDSLASIFAPLLGLDGVLRSFQRRTRPAMSLVGRGLALLAGIFPILAVCAPNPVIAWLAILASIMASRLPTLARRWNDAVLAFVGAGVALFGLLWLMLTPTVVGYFGVFAGFAAIAAVVPELAPVLVVLVLRLAGQTSWPPAAEAIGVGVALGGLLACGAVAILRSSRPVVSLLQQGQASIAALSLCLGWADGRFAALVLLILLFLCRSAARMKHEPVASLAVAGLSGAPPLGVFPGLVLVALALANHHPWLLLPVGCALVPILLAGLPRRLLAFSPGRAIPSIGWLPLALALLIGYFAPDGLVRWWHVLTAGQG